MATSGPVTLPRFTGVVLAGGRSSRMGTDKALLVVDVDGRPLVSRAAQALADAGAGEVLVIGGDAPALGALGLDARPDDHPGEGPLGAILTALRLAGEDLVMVLACDMPAIDAASVRAIVGALAAAPEALVAAPLVDDRGQYLTAAYRRGSQALLGAAYRAGERAPR
ncbi:MAG TPA: molybdenum cofactor guanylyltransferase, partial [Acidimicrobiales bacterium]